MTPTPRDRARRHWYDLADPDGTPSAETMEWLRQMALKMIAADGLPAADRREEVFEASGLKGPAYDPEPQMILLALREFEHTPQAAQALSAAEFVADRLDWDPDCAVAPDSHRKKIMRTIETLTKEEQAWVRSLLRRK